MLGDIAQGSQAIGAAVQQSHLETKPAGSFKGLGDLGGDMPEGLAQQAKRQALARITVGAGGFGGNPSRQVSAPGTQAIGAPFAGVVLDVAQVVIIAQALKDHIPEGHQGRESPLIEGPLGEGQPPREEGHREELVELAQQLAGRKASVQQSRRRRCGFLGGVGRGAAAR